MKLTILALILSVFLLLSFIPNVSATDWWNATSFPFRWEINETNATTGQPFSVNGTSGVGKEEVIIWTLPRTEKIYLYCDTENCDNIRAIANETDELNWENESSRTGNNPQSVWSDYTAVLHFGNGSGTIAHDSADNYNFSFKGAGEPLWQTSGRFWEALLFDGTDDYIINTTLLDTPPDNGTISLWFKPNMTYVGGIGGLDGIFWKGSDATNYIYLYLDVDDKLKFVLRAGGAPLIAESTTTVWNAGQWYHIALVWGGASAMELWVNGTKEGTNAHTGSWGAGTTYDFCIGNQLCSVQGSEFNGTIDEFRVINKRLSATEVQEEYWNGINNLTHLELGETSIPPNFPVNGDFFCNRFIIDNVYVHIENASSCSFILNDADNATGDCNLTVFNSTININLGENNLTVIWWNASGINTKQLLFNGSICCNSSYENDTICAGLDFSNIARCKKFGAFTFQFDYGNMTPCVSGCMDGSCINRTSCLDRCRTGEVTCNKNYRTLCGQKPNGCLDWTTDNQEYCSFGCMNGVCMNCTNECNYGGSKCFGSQLRWCDDDNKDGCFEYSLKNSSDCEFGCNEELNMTTGLVNVSCNYHSFDDTYILRQGFLAGAKAVDYIFPTLLLRTYLSLLVALVGGFLITVKTGSGWRGGLGVMAIVIFIAAWLGWFMWPGAIIFFIFTAFMFTRGDRSG